VQLMVAPTKLEILLLLLGAACKVVSSADEQSSRALSSSMRANRTYSSYSNSVGHPYLSVFLGVALSSALFAGFVFLIDRETFDDVVGSTFKCAKKRCGSSCARRCVKPRIDDDDDRYVPNTAPEYITPETAEYLSNKHDQEVERPKRMLLATQHFIREKASKYLGTVQHFLPNSAAENFRIPLPDKVAKVILPKRDIDNSDEDKYHIRDLEEIPTDEQTLEDKVAYQLWHGKEEIQEKIEDIRLRMFWKPTKDLDAALGGKDKYNVAGEEQEAEIQCNSWFEEDANAPWS